jgi:hypothetical protein
MLDAMNAYALRLHQQAQQTAADIATYVKNRTVERARADTNWVNLADNIEVWSKDGQYVIGVQDNELASQAFQIEYGDESRPPAPLFRLMGRDLADAHQQAAMPQGYSGRD